MLAATWTLAGGCVVFGMWTDLTVGVARDAARVLLGVMP